MGETVSRGHTFCYNQDVLDSGILRITTRRPIISCLTHVTSLYQPTIYNENDDTVGKGKRMTFLLSRTVS